MGSSMVSHDLSCVVITERFPQATTWIDMLGRKWDNYSSKTSIQSNNNDARALWVMLFKRCDPVWRHGQTSSATVWSVSARAAHVMPSCCSFAVSLFIPTFSQTMATEGKDVWVFVTLIGFPSSFVISASSSWTMEMDGGKILRDLPFTVFFPALRSVCSNYKRGPYLLSSNR